jgi:hypothetical protein
MGQRTHPGRDPGYDDREPTMSDTTEMQALAASELTIVPVPQRDAWAVVNRRGDLLAVGQYDECRRRLDRAVAATAA